MMFGRLLLPALLLLLLLLLLCATAYVLCLSFTVCVCVSVCVRVRVCMYCMCAYVMCMQWRLGSDMTDVLDMDAGARVMITTRDITVGMRFHSCSLQQTFCEANAARSFVAAKSSESVSHVQHS